MYEELVKRLRHDSESRALMVDAADAIEELAKDLERSKEWESFWEKEASEALKRFQVAVANKPRWIPVTELLPEDRSDVLAYLKYEVGGRIAAANYDKGIWQDCVMGGLYRTEEGVVTHWMPIPEPPKEGDMNT